MQRIPTRSVSPRPAVNQKQTNGNGDVSPALLLARRIREEQGVEQVGAFLSAMTPFVAPNELKRIAEGFGIPYDRITPKIQQSRHEGAADEQRYQQKANNNNFSANMPFQQQSAVNQNPQQMQVLQTLMQMQGFMGGGKADPMQLFRMMGKK